MVFRNLDGLSKEMGLCAMLQKYELFKISHDFYLSVQSTKLIAFSYALM